MVVYESKDSMRKNLVDKERFERFHTTLKAVGIEIRKVMGVFLENIEESEVRDIVSKKSMNALPINMYQGVSISIGDYLSDKDLTNFLDVPPPLPTGSSTSTSRCPRR